MYCTEVLVTLSGLFGALVVIWRPGNRAPCPRRYPPGYCAQRRALTNHGTPSKQRHTGTLGFRRGKIFNSPEFLRHFEETRIGEFWNAMVLFRNLPKNIRKFFLNF